MTATSGNTILPLIENTNNMVEIVNGETTRKLDVTVEEEEKETMIQTKKFDGVMDKKPCEGKRRRSEILTVPVEVEKTLKNSISMPQFPTAGTTAQDKCAAAAAAIVNNIQVADEEKEMDLSNPHNLLLSFLRQDGYKAQTIKSPMLKDFFLELRDEHVEAYNVELVKAVRDRDIPFLRSTHKSGKTLQCSNRFGESLLHMACRRGYTDVVRFLINEAKVTLRVKDDFGRTPLHDACWSANPNFDLMDLIIENDPDLLLIEDVRGHTPFSYARRSHWKDWSDFLTLRRDTLRLNTFS